MLIDCATCVARHVACRDCIVTVLLAQPAPASAPDPHPVPADRFIDLESPIDLDQDERDALGTLARAGLVPPLRLVRALPDLHGNIRDTA
jgi:hypothetical protein